MVQDRWGNGATAISPERGSRKGEASTLIRGLVGLPGGRAILRSNGPGRELPALQASPLGRRWGSDISNPLGSDTRSPRPQGRVPHGAMGGYRTGLTSCAWKRHGGRRRGPTPQQSVFRRESSQGHFCRKPLHGQWNDPYSDQAASKDAAMNPARPPPNYLPPTFPQPVHPTTRPPSVRNTASGIHCGPSQMCSPDGQGSLGGLATE